MLTDEPTRDKVDEMRRRLKRHPDGDFTIEAGRGQTYATGLPTLYFHHPYGRSSVLAGRWARCYLGGVGNVEQFLDGLPADLKPVTKSIVGSTHVDVDIVTAHLSDKEDDR